MKKIANNSILSKIAVVFNILILVVFIISMVLLSSYDKINVQLVAYTPKYTAALDNLREAEQPMRMDSAMVAHYQFRVDTLKAKEMPKVRKDVQKLQEEITRVSGILDEKIATRNYHDSIREAKQVYFDPIETHYHQLDDSVAKAAKSYMLAFVFCFVLLIVKIVVFAIWNYKNAINVRGIADWSEKSSKPYWAYVGWLIPVYNLVKPYSFFRELYDDTDYILRDKGIVPFGGSGKEDNTDLYLGLWWGFFLIAVVLMVVVINQTFFTTGSLFVKLNHVNVIIASTIIWAIYLFFDSFVMMRYNKMNKMLLENQDKM